MNPSLPGAFTAAAVVKIQEAKLDASEVSVHVQGSTRTPGCAGGENGAGGWALFGAFREVM